jgi:hypothetical protein
MRRRIAVAVAMLLAATTVVLFGPVRPASAWVVCGGTGAAAVAPGLLYPVLLGIGLPGAPAAGKDHVVDVLIGTPLVIHTFTFGFAVGGCVHPPAVGVAPAPAAGVLTGYCGHSVGAGTFAGQPFSFVSVGGVLILTGHVVGIVNAVPAPLTGSCAHFATAPGGPFALPSGATAFVVTGGAVGFNCTNALPPTDVIVPLAASDTLLGGPMVGLHLYLDAHLYFTATCVGSPVL